MKFVISIALIAITTTATAFAIPHPGLTGLIYGKVGSYQKLHKLGSGSFGVVYEAKHVDDPTNQHVALKCIKRGVKGLFSSELLHEFTIQQAAAGPYILQAKTVVDGDGEKCMVLELAKGGTLGHYLRHKYPLTLHAEQRYKPHFFQVAKAVAFIHSRRIAHRDLKPDNIFIKDGEVRVADFGLACFIDADRDQGGWRHLRGGTVGYMAPEIKTTSAIADQRLVDVYAIGKTFKKLVGAIQSTEFKDLVSKMCADNPAERFTMAQVLQHPWFKDMQ